MTTSSKPTSQQRESSLKSKYLAALPDEVRTRVFEVTSQLARPLGEWVARHPLMRPVRVPQICLTLAVPDPYCDVAALQPAVRLVAWIFAVDDLTDEGNVSPDEVWARLERCLQRLESAQAPGEAEDPLYQGLWEIREDVARLPLFSALRKDWERSLRQLVDSMRREHQWSTRYREFPEQPLPTYSEYVENGRCSVGVLPIFLSAFMAVGKPEMLARLPALFVLEQQAASCIRLANDLRSYEKEMAEGKLNSIVLVRRELAQREGLSEAAALERAVAFTRERIKEGLAQCEVLARAEGNPPGWAELFLIRIAGFSCDFYTHHDYHHSLTRENG